MLNGGMRSIQLPRYNKIFKQLKLRIWLSRLKQPMTGGMQNVFSFHSQGSRTKKTGGRLLCEVKVKLSAMSSWPLLLVATALAAIGGPAAASSPEPPLAGVRGSARSWVHATFIQQRFDCNQKQTLLLIGCLLFLWLADWLQQQEKQVAKQQDSLLFPDELEDVMLAAFCWVAVLLGVVVLVRGRTGLSDNPGIVWGLPDNPSTPVGPASCTHSCGVLALSKVSSDTTNGELKTGLGRRRSGSLLVSSSSLSFSCCNQEAIGEHSIHKRSSNGNTIVNTL